MVGAVQVEMDEAAAAVRARGGEVPANVVAVAAIFSADWLWLRPVALTHDDVVALRTDSFARRRTNPDKYYLVDTGLIGAAKFKDDAENGWLLENFVYNTLRRDSAKIEYYLTKSGKEVDFLVTDAITHEKRLVQVTWEMSDTATFERERSALVEARSESGIEDCMIVTWEDEREMVNALPLF